MTITTANCPSCGGPIEFKIGSSIVVVCEYCNSAIARTDRDLRNLGKVADLLDTRSSLAVGTSGQYRGHPFVLTGRSQLKHSAGGVWDEWYASFGGNSWGWLAEAQGRFYITFPQRVTEGQLIAPFEALTPGAAVVVPGSPNRYIVSELGAATYLSAEGEIPFALTPNETYRYADLEGDQGAFATLDYSESPALVFHGHEVTLAEIGIRVSEDTFDAKQRRVKVERLTCPKCGGPMALIAPDKSLRVTCPNCNSLLDVNHGNLSFLTVLDQGPQPAIPLGSTGEFKEGKLVLAGFMQRWCTVDGVGYFWDEYLLYNPQLGFRWLVNSDDHWTYVRPLSAGQVFDGENTVSHRNKTFKKFNAANAIVGHVAGEFYWRVEVGECTFDSDFISPPEMVSRQSSPQEINWSIGHYLPHEELEKAFKLQSPLPRPTTVGAAQPNTIGSPLRLWLTFTGLALLLLVVLFIALPGKRVFHQMITMNPLDNKDATQTFFSQPFEMGGIGNVRVEVAAPVENSWLFVEGDLVNEETGLVQNFSLPVEYYYGVDGGESWTEGSKESTTFLSSLPGGRYSLRLEAQWGAENAPAWERVMPVTVTITQGVPRLFHFFAVVVLLAIPALIQFIRRRSFEVKRWSQSSFSPYESSDE